MLLEIEVLSPQSFNVKIINLLLCAVVKVLSRVWEVL
jgi:hypothetical protein